MIPTLRTIALGLLPTAVILLGRGAPAAVTLAWELAGLILVAFLLDGWRAGRRRRVRLERQAPAQLHVEQPCSVTWVVENLGPSPLSLQLADGTPAESEARPPTLALTVPPRARTTASYELVPLQRGPLAFGDLTYRVRGPMGLAWRQLRLAAHQEVRCLPYLANWKTAELAERRALMRQSGSHRYRWRGSGTVFESLRAYNTQDDIRWVEWKATARTGQPISRNFEVDRHQQIVLLLDGSRAMTTYCGRRTKFDAVLEACILVSRAVLDQGDSLGLMLFSDRIDVDLHPRRERAQATAVMEQLYDKQPRLVEPNFELALTQTATRNLRRSLIILFTDVTVLEAARRMLAYLRILTPRHLPLVVTIADETVEHWEQAEPHTAGDFYRVGVANELMHERAVLLEELRRRGAEVLDCRADQVAVRSVERYLELKRRLRL
jgi:uncharacterized protein (DUF58 family)